MEKLELNVQLSAKQYYHFNVYHCYHSLNGILSIFLGIVCMAYGIVFQEALRTAQVVMFVALGVLFIIYNPIALYLRSKRRFLQNPVMKNPVAYQFAETGITLKQGEVEEEMLWENIYKIVKTRESMIFYLTKYHANIIPLSEMDGRYDQVCAYISQYADAKAIRFKI
ncbi:MAG: YcxB family protein [Lachnospiraceae bacterium]|nr:YcxB family protein [Lachnospiraceae bacterium]